MSIASAASADKCHVTLAAGGVFILVLVIELPQRLQVLGMMLRHKLLPILAEDVALKLRHLPLAVPRQGQQA